VFLFLDDFIDFLLLANSACVKNCMLILSRRFGWV